MILRTLPPLALLLLACEADPPSQPAPTGKPIPVDSEVENVPDLHADPIGPSRKTRRMTIDQLQASMKRVAGNDLYGNPIEWKVNGQPGLSDAAFGKALGRPDFLSSTDESGISSALYLKFVGDAARAVCMDMAKTDLLRTDASTRVLFPKSPVDGTATDEQVSANLSYLVLRFLGTRLDKDSPMLAALRGVFDAGVASIENLGGELPPSAEGYRAVCVTLFESPLFHNN